MLGSEVYMPEKGGNVLDMPLKNSKRSKPALNTVRLGFLLVSAALFIFFLPSSDSLPDHLAVVRGLRALYGNTLGRPMSSTVASPNHFTACGNVDENSPAFWDRVSGLLAFDRNH